MKNAIKLGNQITAGFIILFTLLAVFAPSFPVIEHFTEHLVYVLIIMFVMGLVGLVIGSRTVLFTSFGCAMVLAIFLKNASNADLKNPEVKEVTNLRVTHVNLSSLSDVTSLQNILATDTLTDVYSFQEFTPDWASILPSLLSKFDYSYIDVQIDVYGKAIYSRSPLINKKILNLDSIKILNLSVAKNTDTFDLYSVYLTPALDSESRIKAKNQLESLQKLVTPSQRPTIVLGEFNQVYWSPEILEFRKQTGLQNSRRDVELGTTKMPYNHIFYSTHLECFEFSELNDVLGEQIGCRGALQSIVKIAEDDKDSLHR